MFKSNHHRPNHKLFTQQRAVLKPMKNIAIYEEEEGDEDDDIQFDDTSSCYSSGVAVTHESRNDTMMLAQFLSTTGPEEYAAISQQQQQHSNPNKMQQFKRASRLLSRLRKRPTMPVLRSEPTPPAEKKTHIPLPVFEYYDKTIQEETTHAPKKKQVKKKQEQQQQQQQQSSLLRDSGIYSEANSDMSSSFPPPPLPPFTTVMSDLQFPQPPLAAAVAVKSDSSPNNSLSPRRPPPLPPALASAAIATATSVCSSSSETVVSSRIRSVPEAALKRRSVRLRHVQVQTSDDEVTHGTTAVAATAEAVPDKQACPHCRQTVTRASSHHDSRLRRPSCPPALASGPTLTGNKETDDAKVLLAMIVNLKSQLEEEKQCRLQLEKVISQRQADDKRLELAKEKDRWAGDCLWLNDRIALLPE